MGGLRDWGEGSGLRRELVILVERHGLALLFRGRLDAI